MPSSNTGQLATDFTINPTYSKASGNSYGLLIQALLQQHSRVTKFRKGKRYYVTLMLGNYQNSYQLSLTHDLEIIFNSEISRNQYLIIENETNQPRKIIGELELKFEREGGNSSSKKGYGFKQASRVITLLDPSNIKLLGSKHQQLLIQFLKQNNHCLDFDDCMIHSMSDGSLVRLEHRLVCKSISMLEQKIVYAIIGDLCGKGAEKEVYFVKGLLEYAKNDSSLNYSESNSKVYVLAKETLIEDQFEQFKKEMQLTKRIDYLGLEESVTGAGFFLNRMPGNSLEAYLNEVRAGHEQLTERDCVMLAYQIIAASYKLHQNYRLVHRDIKPANIMVEKLPPGGNCLPRFNINFIDFSFATLLDEKYSYRKITSEGTAGTAGYIAPEAFENTPPAAKFDIYSLASVTLDIILAYYRIEAKFDNCNPDDINTNQMTFTNKNRLLSKLYCEFSLLLKSLVKIMHRMAHNLPHERLDYLDCLCLIYQSLFENIAAQYDVKPWKELLGSKINGIIAETTKLSVGVQFKQLFHLGLAEKKAHLLIELQNKLKVDFEPKTLTEDLKIFIHENTRLSKLANASPGKTDKCLRQALDFVLYDSLALVAQINFEPRTSDIIKNHF